MADMFAPLVAQLKANPKTIVFTEGNDPRILEAAAKLLAEGVLKVVMVGNEAECKAAAAAGNFDISAAEIIDPENYAGFDEMVNTMVELRKGKQTAEECTALLKKSNYFGTMLVKMGKADCLGRRYLLHCRHHSSRSAAGQDQEGRTSGQLLLHSGP